MASVHVIADLRDVDFLDSTGLGALVGSLKRLRLREGSLELVTSGGRILQIFQITGLTRAFALHSSVPDAITADQHWQATIAGQGDDAQPMVPGERARLKAARGRSAIGSPLPIVARRGTQPAMSTATVRGGEQAACVQDERICL